MVKITVLTDVVVFVANVNESGSSSGCGSGNNEDNGNRSAEVATMLNYN